MLFRNWTRSIAPEGAPTKSGEQATRASMADLALPLRCWGGFGRDALRHIVFRSIAPEGAPTKRATGGAGFDHRCRVAASLLVVSVREPQRCVDYLRTRESIGCEGPPAPTTHCRIPNPQSPIPNPHSLHLHPFAARCTPATARPDGSAAFAKAGSQAIAAADEQAIDLPPGIVCAQASPGKCCSNRLR